jgi:hypothetical protein
MPDPPDHAGEEEGEEDVEGGARGEDEHLGPVGDRRQLGRVDLALALDGTQVRDLGQEDVAAEWEPGDLVARPVGALPREDGRPEADREHLDVDAPARAAR